MEKKVILVTGASRGIGRQIAITLAEAGNIVIANYNKSEQKALELKNLGYDIDIFKCDVSKRDNVKNMIDSVIKKHGKIDVLVNNAGIDQVKLFTEITDTDWNNMIQNNLYSVFCCTQETVKYMIEKKSRINYKYFIYFRCYWWRL